MAEVDYVCEARANGVVDILHAKLDDLPQRAVKSSLQTTSCCINGNRCVVNDEVKNGDNDL